MGQIAKKVTPRKAWDMVFGTTLIGIGVGFYRMSMFGVDAFSCMNLGVSGFLGMSFGNWQLIMNCIILVAVFFTMRENIGLGTVVNMVGVGYIADFVWWLLAIVAEVQAGIVLRVIFLCIGSVFAALGCAMYMHAKLGIAPYDSIAFIVMKLMRQRISFRAARVSSDVVAVTIGIVFCLIAGNNVWAIVGLGTITNALFNGPLIQFFQRKLEEKA